MIPRILHFTWKTTELPREMADYYGKWQALHPDWDIRLWTDESMRAFVAEAYPEFLAIYDSYPKMIQRADAFRCLVLGKLGGIYADLDVEPFAAMTPLLEYDAFMGIEPLEHIFPDRIHQGVPFLFTNAFMGSVPNHKLWQTIIASLPDLVGRFPAVVARQLFRWGLPVPDGMSGGFTALHWPLGSTLVALVAVQFVEARDRWRAFGWLVGGITLHQATDLLQDHHGQTDPYLYPSTTWGWEAGLTTTEGSLQVAPWLALATAAVWAWRFWRVPAFEVTEVDDGRRADD